MMKKKQEEKKCDWTHDNFINYGQQFCFMMDIKRVIGVLGYVSVYIVNIYQ